MEKSVYRIVDDIEFCYCVKCKEYHDCTEFGYDTRTPHGYSKTCEKMMKERLGFKSHFSQSQFNRKSADEILTKLGYNLKSTIPVHEQFLIKHDL